MRHRTFQVRLDSRVRQLGFVLVIFAAVLLLAYRVAHLAWADEQLGTYDLAIVQKAIALDPRNPALHHWAGLLYIYGSDLRPDAAIHELRVTTELNGQSALYFNNLGKACFIGGDQVCARTAYEKAAQLAPRTPRFQAELAAYYMVSGETELALTKFRDLLQMQPESAASVLRTCLRAIDPDVAWDRLLRDCGDIRPKLALINLLTESNQFEKAQGFWQGLVASRPSLALDDAKPYMAQLEARRDYEQLSRVWQDLESLGTSGMPKRDKDNLVVNGDFGATATNTGLDWHIRQEQFLMSVVDRDPDTHALKLDFTVPANTEHEPASQVVPVAPGSEYELRARVRSQDIASDSGPRLRVVDLQCPECVNVTGENTTGTTPWHEVTVTFVAAPSTRFVRLSIWRPRSRAFPTEIQGQFWVNSVSIRPLGKALRNE